MLLSPTCQLRRIYASWSQVLVEHHQCSLSGQSSTQLCVVCMITMLSPQSKYKICIHRCWNANYTTNEVSTSAACKTKYLQEKSENTVSSLEVISCSAYNTSRTMSASCTIYKVSRLFLFQLLHTIGYIHWLEATILKIQKLLDVCACELVEPEWR